MMSGYPSITYHNSTSICGKKKWNGFRKEGFSTDIIAICETWFPEDENDRKYDDDYEGYFCNRPQKKKKKNEKNSGGCALWLNKETCKKKRCAFKSTGDKEFRLEALCVTFKYNDEYFAVLVIYSPPGRSRNGRSMKNTELVQKMLEEEIHVPMDNYIVIGDFNRSTLGTERQLRAKFYDYSRGVSELNQIYGTKKPRPYSVSTRDPKEFNKHHKRKTKDMHMIIELEPKDRLFEE